MRRQRGAPAVRHGLRIEGKPQGGRPEARATEGPPPFRARTAPKIAPRRWRRMPPTAAAGPARTAQGQLDALLREVERLRFLAANAGRTDLDQVLLDVLLE